MEGGVSNTQQKRNPDCHFYPMCALAVGVCIRKVGGMVVEIHQPVAPARDSANLYPNREIPGWRLLKLRTFGSTRTSCPLSPKSFARFRILLQGSAIANDLGE